MIINDKNKDRIIKDNIQIKKGFNQTPADIVDKINRDLKQTKELNQEKSIDNKVKEYDPVKFKNALNNLNKKL